MYTITNVDWAERFLEKQLDREVFMAIITAIMARPKKAPKDRKTDAMRIPMTAEERRIIEAGAQADGMKPVTWLREVGLRAAKRRQ